MDRPRGGPSSFLFPRNDAARLAAGTKPKEIHRGSNPEEAFTLIIHSPPAPHLISRVGHAQAELGDKAGALETFRLALRAAKEMSASGESQETITGGDISALVEITKGFQSLDAREEVREVLDHAGHLMDSRKIAFDDQQLMPFIIGIHAAADIEGAFRLIEPVVAGAKDPGPSRLLLGDLYKAIAEALDTTDRDAAGKTLGRLHAGALAVDESSRKVAALAAIAIAYGEIGDFAKALEVARPIGDGTKTIQTYNLRDPKLHAMTTIGGRRATRKGRGKRCAKPMRRRKSPAMATTNPAPFSPSSSGSPPR